LLLAETGRAQTTQEGRLSKAASRSPTVILAEDDVLLREGIASLLETHGFAVEGQAGDPDGLLALMEERQPDLVIVDIRMPPTHTTEGLEAARVIKSRSPEVGVLVLSAHVEVEEATALLADQAGVGYLLKSRVTDVAEFIDALQRVAAGGSVVDPALVQELFARKQRGDPLSELSPRELDVLALMAEGRSNAGIARQLFLAEGTVEKHVKSILGKLDIQATADDHRRVLAVVTYLENR
jgi:DNA-binding NarL/FixJ family response regulator